MNLKHPQIFLLDGIGALVSASMLGIVLVQLQELFGMPVNILYVLAGIAFIFFLYSITCYLKIKEKWQAYLRAIAIANLSYCVLTGILVIYYIDILTVFGIGYFIGEMLVIVVLAGYEFRIISGP